MDKPIERSRFQQSITRAATICFVLAVSVPSVAGQFRVGGVKVDIRKPEVTKPANSTAGTANQPAATNGNTGSSSRATGEGPSAQEVNAFKEDARIYKEGILRLSNMQDDMGKDWSPIYNADFIRPGLEQGAALAAIVRQKYPNIENPSWASNFEDKVGTWRHLAEDRETIVKAYLSEKVGVAVKLRAKQLDKDRANLSTHAGFSLPADFDDREKAHAAVAKEFSPTLALVGRTMPDTSVFAAYDTALDTLVAEARKRAGEWGWGATSHDPTIEARVRSWLPKLDPKAQVISMGLTDATWQVNKNSLGIPEGRYRRGLVMYRKPGVEPCVVAKFSFEQTYMGGGQYNAMSNTSGFTYLVRLQTCK